MAITRLVERVSEPFAGSSVDRDKGVIRGVKLCGVESANNRIYPPEMFRRDYAKYEGVSIFANHGEQRSIGDKLGWVSNPRVDADGTPRGDANLLKTHPLYETVMEAAERNPSLFGFSHVAMCHTHYVNSKEHVEGLQEVESVDLVASPATTKGFFESKGSSRVPYTIAKLVEWVVKHPKSTTKQILKIKSLCEEDSGMYAGADMGAMPDTGPTTDPADAITSGFEAALMSVVRNALSGKTEPTDALKTIKKLLMAHCDTKDVASGGSDGGDGSDGTDSNGTTPNSESKKNKNGDDTGKRYLEATKALEAAGLPLKSSLISLVASGATEAERTVLITTLKESAGSQSAERITGAGGRHQTAKLEEQTNGTASEIPADAKAFAKWCSE